jgi:acyl-CoA thioesterase FadM
MWFADVRDRSFKMSFDVVRETDGALLATGFNSLVTVNAAGAPVRIPDSIRALILAS